VVTEPPEIGAVSSPTLGTSKDANKGVLGAVEATLPDSTWESQSGLSDSGTTDCPTRENELRPTNSILANLPAEEFNRLKPHLQGVSFRRGKVVRDVTDRIDSLCFPLAGMIGLFSVMADGGTAVLAATGREGFLGVGALLAAEMAPLRAVVLVEGHGLNLDSKNLQRVLPSASRFAAALRCYCNSYLAQVHQIGACHALHTVQQRVASWLLMVRERSDSDSLPLTHDSLSEMLGCRRPSVTDALSALEKAGFIRRSRGRIYIRNRAELADHACECYGVLRDRGTFG
jgi:CRP-like cAMP-binding protein